MSLRLARRAGAAAVLALVVSLGCGERHTRSRPEQAAAPTPESSGTSSPVGALEGATLEGESAFQLRSQSPEDEWAGIADAVSELEHPEMRVRIYWANEDGWPIHSQTQAYPDGHVGERTDVSVEGAHVAMKLNRLQIGKTSSGGPDLNELARTLRDIIAPNPMPVVVDARPTIHFRWVIAAVDACARARVESVTLAGVSGLKSLNPCTLLLDDRRSLDARDGMRMALPFSLTVKPEVVVADRPPRIVVNVLYPGETIVIERRALEPERLDAFIADRAKAAGTDEDGRPLLAARIRCDSACTFQPVLHTMRACAKAGITDVTFAARGVTEEDLIRFRRDPGNEH